MRQAQAEERKGDDAGCGMRDEGCDPFKLSRIRDSCFPMSTFRSGSYEFKKNLPVSKLSPFLQ